MIAPQTAKTNEEAAVVKKLAGPKAKKRGASRDVHARCSIEASNEYEVNCARVDNITRTHLRTRASN